MRGRSNNGNWTGLTGLALMALLVMAGCEVTSDDFTGTNIMQRTVLPGTAETMSLTSGNTLVIPAGTFDRESIVIFANTFTGTEANPVNFPTTTKDASDIAGAAVINTPVDRFLSQDLTLTFDVIDPNNPRFAAQLDPNTEYQVYRFDYETVRWQPWGATTATTNASGNRAVAVLPTDGFLGFIGSVALFHGLEAIEPVQTVLQGTVVNLDGDGISTDVGVYVSVGGLRVPIAVDNGRVPDVNDAQGEPFTTPNTVNSDAGGSFRIELPDSLVGQLINLEFGTEDPERQTQTRFDILAPHPRPDSNVTSMSVQYGTNNVRSQAVRN